MVRSFWAFLLAAVLLLSAGCGKAENDTMENYRKTVHESKYIIHALGGMDDDFYINSVDCLETVYAAGYRIFEVDVSFTSDDVLVLAHSGEKNIWSRNDWTLRFGQEYPFEDAEGNALTPEEENLLIEDGYDVEKHLCPASVFTGFKIQGKYKASTFSDLLDFMEAHEDMYVMLDAGKRSYEDTCIYYKRIVEEAGKREGVLDRFIAGGQTTEMLRAAKEAYDFPLLNLYYDVDEEREESIYRPEDFIKYCKEQGVTSFSASTEAYSEDAAKELSKSGLISYIFTINDPDEEEKIRSLGADMIGTDFLWK